MDIIKSLYIVPTNQMGRSLKEVLVKNNPFVIVKTLENIISEIFNSNNIFLDKNIATSLIYKIINENSINYFSYLNIDSDSLAYIYDFIVKCKRNDIKFDTIISGEKLEAITEIDMKYQEFKVKNNLYDLSDMEKRVYSLISENYKEKSLTYFDDFDEVFIYDKFFIGKTNFFTSKYQEMLFNVFKKSFTIYKLENKLKKNAKLIKAKNEVFDNIDEIKTAFKIVRQLMENGVEDRDIIIVTTDMQEYAPLFRLFLTEYGLKGYDSIGIPLISYKGKYFTSGDSVMKSYNEFKQNFDSLKIKFNSLGLKFDEDYLKSNLLNNHFVLSDKIGIELTEPNQLLASSKSYKHIIFIGTDIEHFPPKAEDNFLYTIKESIEYFYTNNYYYSSEIQFDELKNLADNLYIINANYKDKKKLAPSVLIPENFDLELELSDIKSVNDITKIKQIAKPKVNLEQYIKSINNIFFTEFDGIGVENIKVEHLSASQLNKFSACPLSYLYFYNMQIKAPKKANSGFDSMDIGTLMHEIFEKFTKKVQEGENSDYKLMKSVLNSVQEEKSKKLVNKNIFHDIIFEDFRKGLEDTDDDDRDKGVLAEFVDYIDKNLSEFENLKNSEFEKKFYLNKELEITDDSENYFIKGFIDRVDNLNDYANVIDYKSKNGDYVSASKELNRVNEFKEFQLSLYTLYAKQFYKKDVIASFLTFKGKKKNYLEYAKVTTILDKAIKIQKNGKIKELGSHFNDEFEINLKNKIFEIKDSIESGNFNFNNSDEDVCGYCEMKHLCHQTLLTKEL